MPDEPTLDSKHLGAISADFVKVADKLQEASYTIRRKGHYDCPIFIVSKVPVAVGTLLIAPGEADNAQYYYAAYLDALIQCQIIAQDRVEAFRQAYKDPDEFCCLLVVEERFVNFLYTPYPVD
ncbi:MAG: hypothetical protein AAFP93_02045 [Bacteroidota bacterium]